jgi:uncharacterized membrane protein
VIGDFIYKYYIDPIIQVGHYNVVNTLTYAAILIVMVYFVYRWLRRTCIAIDHAFVMATLPYLILGGVLRVVEDTGMVPYPWHVLLVTPLIFFIIFVYAISALVLSRALEEHGSIRDTKKGYAAAGIIAVVAVTCILVWFGITETKIALGVLAGILAMAGVTTLAVLAFIRYILRWEFIGDPLYRLLVFGHMLDASATSFGIDLHELSYVEKHVVGGVLIDATGTAFVMFPLKLAVIIPALYILELYRAEGNEELWHLILLAMIMVGMAPGIRDLVRMVLYV